MNVMDAQASGFTLKINKTVKMIEGKPACDLPAGPEDFDRYQAECTSAQTAMSNFRRCDELSEFAQSISDREANLDPRPGVVTYLGNSQDCKIVRTPESLMFKDGDRMFFDRSHDGVRELDTSGVRRNGTEEKCHYVMNPINGTLSMEVYEKAPPTE